MQKKENDEVPGHDGFIDPVILFLIMLSTILFFVPVGVGEFEEKTKAVLENSLNQRIEVYHGALEVEVALDRATVLNTHMRAIPVFVALDGTVRVKSTGENSVIVSLSNLKAFLYEAMKDRQYKRVEIFANRNLPFHLLLKVMREIGQEGEVKILFIANEREEQ